MMLATENSQAQPTQVSLVLTVLNEVGSLPALLTSVLEQTVRPADIVVVDGGSTDGTPDIVRDFMDTLPLRLVVMPGANISEGRNAAIRMARYDVIAVTDAGVRLDRRWVEQIASPLLREDSGIDVVSGFFRPDPLTPFERAMGATVLPAQEDIDPEGFLPSSRSVAFRKGAWARSGGYPEWLDYCEDLVFDLRMKAMSCKFAFAPGAVAYFRPRPNLRSFFLQYYRYARGDGKADLWRKRHAVRYAAYVLGPALAFIGAAARRGVPGKALLMFVGLAAAGYCRRPYMRLLPMLRGLSPGEAAYALSLVPVIRVVGDVAKMLGYPVGVVWRLKQERNGAEG